jgi:hypothetical protein
MAAIFAVAPLGAQQAQSARPAQVLTREALAKALAALASDADGIKLPPAAAFTFGDSTVAAGAKVGGTVAVASGTLHVRGSVAGDVVTYGGDIVVHEGGEVSGNAIALLGRVTMDGGRVNGETRAIGGNLAAVSVAAAARTPRSAVMESLALAGGWLAVLAIVGIGVLVFASTNLDAVSETLQRDFGRAFLAGIGGQLALLPVLALLLVALTLTILGILLIPFAIVAYVLAAAGLVTLGYLAIARITGRTLFGGREEPHDEGERRAAALKAMILGLVIVISPWGVAALLAWSPSGRLVAQTMALGITWVACTAGLGAALISRGGVRRVAAPAAQRAMSAASWTTPTPVSGVAAARRPTPVSTSVPK